MNTHVMFFYLFLLSCLFSELFAQNPPAVSESQSWLNSVIIFHNYDSQEVNQRLFSCPRLSSCFYCGFPRAGNPPRAALQTRWRWRCGGQRLNRRRLLEEQLINRQPPRFFPPATASAVWRGCFSLSAAHRKPRKSRLVALGTDCIFSPFLQECLFRQRQEGNESFTNINEALH